MNNVKDDFFSVLNAAPDEVPGLLAAVREGRIDGLFYNSDCCCLIGTIAKLKGVSHFALKGDLEPNHRRPIEKYFTDIAEGDTPATSTKSAEVEAWILEWQAAR